MAILNEQFRRMQRLAGIITEEQLNENTKHTELKPLENILLQNKWLSGQLSPKFMRIYWR